MPDVDRDTGDDFDLHLDWVNGPPAERAPKAPLRYEPPRQEPDAAIVERFSGMHGGDRMRLVLALGQSEVELRGAIDAIDTRAASFSDEPSGAIEEVREYIAAAFDTVRELTSQLVVLTDRLELAPGRPPAGQIIEAATAPNGPSPAAPALTARHEPDTEDTRDEPDEPDEVAPRAAAVDIGEFKDVADRIERAIARLGHKQSDMSDEIARLAEAVESYRRRVQVHARPPVVTDAQLREVVDGVAAALQSPTPLPAAPAPDKGSTWRRPRTASVAAEEPPDQTPQDQTPQDRTPEDRTPEDQTPEDQTSEDQTPEEPAAVEHTDTEAPMGSLTETLAALDSLPVVEQKVSRRRRRRAQKSDGKPVSDDTAPGGDA